MYKLVLIFFTVFLSLSSLPAMAANCNGTITFNSDPSDKAYYNFGYTSDNDDPLFIGQFTIQDSMTCDPDRTDVAFDVGEMSMKITGGGVCKDSSTITTPYPGIEWQLDGMYCNGDQITSYNRQTTTWGNQVTWPAGTVLGKAKLIVKDDYWLQTSESSQYNVRIPAISTGNTSVNNPGINVSSVLGSELLFIFRDNATCSMSLSTENLDFGKLTPADVNGNSFYKELSVNYLCKNRSLINGLYLRFEPENVVDAANGIFSANDSAGQKLNFQIGRQDGNFNAVPLNTNYKLNDPVKNDYYVSDTETFRIYVKPSDPFPVGKFSTYLNVSLIYR